MNKKNGILRQSYTFFSSRPFLFELGWEQGDLFLGLEFLQFCTIQFRL